MKKRSWLTRLLAAIAGMTILTGLVQVVAPGVVLDAMSSETGPTSMHFFAIVGMFMVLFGGMLMQALFTPSNQPIAVFWAGLQKFGASIAVAWGVGLSIFSSLALVVAAFDFISGVLIIAHWVLIRGPRMDRHSG